MSEKKPNRDESEEDRTPRRPDADGAGSDDRPEVVGESAADSNLLEQLRTDLEEAKDRVLRSQAELENYRKRAAREVEDHRRYANLPLIRDLLPVLDNIERAVGAADKTHDASALLEGIKLVLQQLETVLQRNHCVRIEALHQPFNPHLHEAITQQRSDEYPANTVIMVTQTGYQLFDRVVRPSQVIVSTTDTSEAS
jgi:molecular chaperone GrpE